MLSEARLAELLTSLIGSPRWPGPPEEDTWTRGVLVVRPVQAGDRSEGAPSVMRPSPSMTAMGSEDNAVAILGQ